MGHVLNFNVNVPNQHGWQVFSTLEVTRSVSEGECFTMHAKPRVWERPPSLTLRVTWLSRLRKLNISQPWPDQRFLEHVENVLHEEITAKTDHSMATLYDAE